MELVWIVLATIPVSVALSSQRRSSELHDRLLRDLDNKTIYDSRIRPFIDDKPVEVAVSMYVSSLHSISESTMDFKLELYFREYWEDPRLAYHRDLYSNLSHIQLHENTAKLVWLPDTFVPNAVHSNNPKHLSISHRFLLRLKPGGRLVYSRRISVTAECPMDLTLYPFDRQVCILSIESYGHSSDDIVYKWMNQSAVAINEALQLPDFTVTSVKVVERNITLTTGTYSRLECCFFFSRKAGYYVFQLFFPATTIVVISWVLLWLGSQAVLGDMIEVIIAVTFLYFSYSTVTPGVSYVKATDVFLGAAFLFVFLAFLKMSYDKKCLKRRRRSSMKKAVEGNQQGCTSDGNKNLSPSERNEPAAATGLLNCESRSFDQKRGIFRISPEQRCLLFFPIAFAVFCLLYFLTYMVITEDASSNRCDF